MSKNKGKMSNSEVQDYIKEKQKMRRKARRYAVPFFFVPLVVVGVLCIIIFCLSLI